MQLDLESGVQTAATSWAERDTIVGREFVSDWLQVDEAHLTAFEVGSYVTQNPNSVNADQYPEGLVEGFHLLSLLDYLVNGVSYVTDDAWSGWNYGLDKVRFVSPVTTRDRIRVRGHIESIEPRGEHALVLYHCQIEVAGREKPGMTAQWRVLWTMVDGE